MRHFFLTLSFIVTTFYFVQAQKQLWGTASAGGEHQNGFIFRTDSIGDNLVIVHHFDKTVDGDYPGGLLLASNNKLYGVTSSGGQGGTDVYASGTFYEYDPVTDRFQVLQHFGPTNTTLPGVAMPKGEGFHALTEISPGLIYGLVTQGRAVFSYNFNTGEYGKPFTLPLYNGGATNSPLQHTIGAAFVKGPDNFYYAASYSNSSCPIANPNMGSIFRLNPANNQITVRYKASCQAEFGYTYMGFLTLANNKFYSAAAYGGTNNKGVLYEYVPATNVYTKLYDFTGGVGNYAPTSLVMGKNGKLYGTAHGGGIPETYLPYGGGVFYEYDLTTSTFTNKYNFLMGVNWVGDMGTFPNSLINGTNGKLYGTTEFGVFEYNITTDEVRMAGRFNERGFAPTIVEICRKPIFQYQEQTTWQVCKDAAFAVDFASTNATTIEWKHDGAVDPARTASELRISSFTAADAGVWVCTLTNECGTTVTQAITLELNEPDRPLIVASGPLVFCAGEVVKLSAPAGFAGYTWSNGATAQDIFVEETGEFTVKVSNGCESPLSEITTVTVRELPVAPSGIEILSFNKLKAIATGELFEWTLNGEVINATTQEITVTESGTYTVKTVSEEGCRSATSAGLTFVITGTETPQEAYVKLYPNPAKGVLRFKSSTITGAADVSVFNAAGQLLIRRSINIAHEEGTLNLEAVHPGVYNVVIRKGETVVVRKIVVM